MVALIRQELIRHMRGKRLLVWMLTLLLVSFFVIVVLWPNVAPIVATRTRMFGVVVNRTTWPGPPGQIGAASRSMLEVFCLLLSVAAALIVPAYGGGAVALERERGTYDQLRLTPIAPVAIVLGKLASIVGIFLLLFVSVMPVIASIYFLLGVDIKVIGQISVAMCTVAVSSAAIGMVCSAACRRMFVAQTLTFLLVFVVLSATTTLLPVATAPLPSILGTGPFTELAPIRALQGAVMGIVARSELAAFVVVHGVLALAASAMATLLIAFDFRIDRAMDPPTPAAVSWVNSRFFVRGPRRPIPAWLNPVMVRELRHGELISWRWQVRLACISLLLLGAGYLAVRMALAAGSNPTAESWVALEMLLALFLVPGMTASSIVQERERGTFDFLLMTGRRPSGVFIGKIFGVLASMAGVLVPCLAATALSLVVFPATGLRDAAVYVAGSASLAVWMFACACASTYACAAIAKPTAALAASYVLSALLFAGFGAGLITALGASNLQSAFVSPAIGFLTNAKYAGKDHLAQFNEYWLTHLVCHILIGVIFFMLALRAVEPFAEPRRRRWQ